MAAVFYEYFVTIYLIAFGRGWISTESFIDFFVWNHHGVCVFDYLGRFAGRVRLFEFRLSFVIFRASICVGHRLTSI